MPTNFTHTYVAELERLILDELLPIYKRWHQEQGLEISYRNLPPDLMQQVKQAKTLPKLMQPW